MDQQDLVVTAIGVSLVAGVFLSPQVDAGKAWKNLQSDLERFSGNNDRQIQEPGNYSFKLGSAHEHAQFFVNLNGSEYNFSKKKFQVRSSYVHMENFKPHIVHKHSENVTWRYFIRTMGISLNHSENRTCITISGERTCGDGSIVLDGKNVSSLDTEIQQGDNLAIVIPESGNITQRYMDKRLPEAYTPDTGTSV